MTPVQNLSTPRISIIAAMARNRAIGINNTLPWHLPADLKYFKNLTMGHTLLMGRKTFDSIGKPLPGRKTIVMSHNPNLTIAGCQVVPTLEAALAYTENESEIFCIGGAEIFRRTFDKADRLYLTEIQADIAGDVYFPKFDTSHWQEISREIHGQEQAGEFEYHFVVYDRLPKEY